MFKKLKWIIRIILFVIILAVFFFVKSGYDMYKEVTTNIPIEQMVEEIRNKQGFVAVEDVPDYYLNSVVAIEDKRFYKHFGVDFLSLGRAMIDNIKMKSFYSGGSTITQQLAKNMYFDQEKKITRKVAEVFVALDLEEKYEKDEILELYINIIYFGDGYYGIYDASHGYLNKEPIEMNLNEATLLAGIPNAPSVYELSNNTPKTYQRQIMVVKALLKEEYIDEDTSNKLIEEIKEKIGEM